MNMHVDERRILATTCYGHFMTHFNMLVFPAVVLPLTQRFQLPMASVLALSFWMYLLFGISALGWGLLADRWSAKFLMTLFYLGSGISGWLAAWWIDSPGALAVALTALGLFSGIYHPVGLGLISKHIRRVGIGMGYNGIFGNLGLAMAPLLAGLANWVWGPRAAFGLIGVLNFCGLVLTPKLHLPAMTSHETSTDDAPASSHMLTGFIILLSAMMLSGLAYRGSTVILPTYFQLKNQEIFQWVAAMTGRGLSQNLVATTVASVIYFIGMVGQFTGGRIADRYELRRSYLIFHACAVPMAFLMAFSGNILLVMLAMAYFFLLLGMQPIENTLVGRFTPHKLRYSAFGTKFILSFGVGALAVKLAAHVELNWGIASVFIMLGSISILLVGCIITLILKTPPQYS